MNLYGKVAMAVIRTILGILWKLFLLYLLFALVSSTVPWLFRKQVGSEARNVFSATDFKGTGTGPDRALLVESTTTAFGVRVQLLRHAEHTLDITYHAVQDGESTEAFLGEVAQAADRGVKVRILLDGKTGAMGEELRLIKALNSHPNITVRMYNPWQLLRPWKWHALLHDKFIVADNDLALLGGRNIGDRYFAPAGYRKEVTNDRDVLVWNADNGADSAIPQIQAYMNLLWGSVDTRPLKEKNRDYGETMSALLNAAAAFEQENPAYYADRLEDYCATSVPTARITLISNPIHTGSKEPWVGYRLRELALTADDHVLLQTPYATANRDLLAAMEEVRARAPLTMVTNSVASSPNFPAFSNYYSQRKKFVSTGAAIYEYQSSHSIHGKSLVVDDRLSAVGSCNMDDRSFYIDTETMLIIDSPEFSAVLSDAIGSYRQQALLVNGENRYEPSAAVAEAPVSNLKKAGMYLVSIISRLFQFLI